MKKTHLIGTIVSASAPLLIYGAVANHIYAEETNPSQTIQTQEITTVNGSSASESITSTKLSESSNSESIASTKEENASLNQEDLTTDNTSESLSSIDNSISFAAANSESNNSLTSQEIYANVNYKVHVQDYGWMDTVRNAEQAGTTGQSKRIEAIIVNVDSNLSGGIEYSAHIQNIGWQEWKSTGELAGTIGQGKRIEAIRFRLTGDLAKYYNIHYSTYIQNYGWLPAAMDGAYSGSQGMGLRVEAIRIWFSHGGASTLGSFLCPNVQYKTHVQDIGWQGTTNEGKTAGTTGQGKRVEALSITLSNPELSGNIEYRTHIQNKGWESTWHKNGEVAGSIGQSLRVEALQIRLTGDVAKYYDVAYRVHVQNYGWLGWALNGTMTGSSQLAKRIEAIEIKLIEKGTTFDSTRMCYVDSYHNYYISGNIDSVWKQNSSGNWVYNGSSTVTDNWVVVGKTKAYRLNSDRTMVKHDDATYTQTPAMREEECLSVDTVLANKSYYLNKNVKLVGYSAQGVMCDSQGKPRITIYGSESSGKNYLLVSKNNKIPMPGMSKFLISGKFKYENGDYVLDADSITILKATLSDVLPPSMYGTEANFKLIINGRLN